MKAKIRVCLALMMALVFVWGGAALAESRPAWQNAYRNFIVSGEYRGSLRSVNPEYSEMLRERDTSWDGFAMFDLDRDGVPELLVRADYAMEQIDVFTCTGKKVVWLGSMGGENFFQAIIRFQDAAYPGVYTLMGGPVMTVDEYTLSGMRLQHRAIGRTVVDFAGMETLDITMQVSDQKLYQLLYHTLVSGPDVAEQLIWCTYTELLTDDYWDLLYLGFTEPIVLK